MTSITRGFLNFAGAATLAASLLAANPAAAQNTKHSEEKTATVTKTDQWIHVLVVSKDNKGEVVRVNVPIEMAEKVLPAINKDNLHDGKVRIDSAHLDKNVDLKALLDALRTSKDGEYVTVQSNENNVRVAKSNGYIHINVTDKNTDKKAQGKAAESKVEIKVPMKVVDALFSAGKDELDVLAALKALAAQGDTELVSVRDAENDIHIWIDSKNSAE